MLHFLFSFCVSNRDIMTKMPIWKKHPYSSHVSKFAIFPSFHSPGGPETRVRPFFNSDTNVLKKTKGKRAASCDERSKVRLVDECLPPSLSGSSCRHEIMESPMKTWKRGVIGPGEDRSKTAFPNPELSDREWSRSRPERTLNMLKNLEKSRWVTSYQLQHTGKDAEHRSGGRE